MHVGKPAVAGIVIGAIVLLSYILFFIISLCCKCCSKKRGCCQRAQPLSYCRRLPYVILVAIGAVVGLIGGIILLSAVPGFADALKNLVNNQVDKVRVYTCRTSVRVCLCNVCIWFVFSFPRFDWFRAGGLHSAVGGAQL